MNACKNKEINAASFSFDKTIFRLNFAQSVCVSSAGNPTKCQCCHQNMRPQAFEAAFVPPIKTPFQVTKEEKQCVCLFLIILKERNSADLRNAQNCKQLVTIETSHWQRKSVSQAQLPFVHAHSHSKVSRTTKRSLLHTLKLKHKLTKSNMNINLF